MVLDENELTRKVASVREKAGKGYTVDSRNGPLEKNIKALFQLPESREMLV